MTNIKSKELINRKFAEGEYLYQLKVWKVLVSRHYPDGLSYRLWFGKDGETLVLYDIHHGKPYHKHIRGKEYDYEFTDLETLISDFLKDTEAHK